jgi:predicted nucleic acid-binding protein
MSLVLVDTSVWVDHFRRSNPHLVSLLAQGGVICHPWIVGELACGTPPRRAETLADLASLQQAQTASNSELMAFVEREQLYGLGCGWVDLQLLAASCLTEGAVLWTHDLRLDALAQRFGRAYRPHAQH